MNFLLRNTSPDPQIGDVEKEQRADIEGTVFEEIEGDIAKLKTRMPIEGHSDVLSNEGGVLIPCRELPEDWDSCPNAAQLSYLDRNFVFPGEQVHILVHISSHDLCVPEIISPFKVAAAVNRNSLIEGRKEGNSETNSINSDVATNGLIDSNAGKAAHESLKEEGHKKRSAHLLESFQNSHFFVRISGSDKPLWQRHDTDENSCEGWLPVIMEDNRFEPGSASGIARRTVASRSLANGDIVVLLQVAIAAQKNMEEDEDVVLEVLQYEQYRAPVSDNSDPSDALLHWLLPLDRSLSQQQPPAVPSPASIIATSQQRLSFGSANSTLFSFGHLRSSSQGSLPPVVPSFSLPAPPLLPPSPLNYAPDEWDRLYPTRESSSRDVGNEGLMSFRGVPLEPQRFSAHCGLEGLYVPGKRWRKKISVLPPVKIDSYFADCNTQDLICVMIENILPARYSGVVIFVDSISLICRSAGIVSVPQPVPISCIEVGEDHSLPGLSLRSGEQHSFIVRPIRLPIKSSATKQAVRYGSTSARSSTEEGTHAIVVSLRCSHSESKFYCKHILRWKPRPARDVMVSVCLENNVPSLVPNEALPHLKSEVLTVRATNLSSKDLDLTLLAPSTFAPSSLPTPEISRPATRVGSSQSFRHGRESEGNIPSAPVRSLSMPQMATSPKKNTERERKASPTSFPSSSLSSSSSSSSSSGADSSLRTHLWLQSRVPLGNIPAHSTTVVKCDLLPLSDGIITLDTLHFASKDGCLYVPESVLQIHSSSSVTKGLNM